MNQIRNERWNLVFQIVNELEEYSERRKTATLLHQELQDLYEGETENDVQRTES